MTSKIVALLILLAFGWAIVRSGEMPTTDERVSVQTRGTRTKRPAGKHPAKMLETPRETETVRIVQHAFGTTEVPLHPTRIISLSSAATDGLVALGVRPMLVEESTTWEGPRVYLSEGLKGVPTIHGRQSISLEAVSQYKPDLIFIGSSQNGQLYSQCCKIAPTVPIGSSAQSNRERRVLDVGDVLGMSEQAKEQLKLYHRFVRQAKTLLASKAKSEPVVFLRFRRNTCVIYTQTALFGPLLFEQLGLKPDPRMPVGGASRGWDVLSLERLSTLTAEHIFMTVDSDSEIYLQQIATTPIWRQLPAAKHGHVHRVSAGTWIGGDGVLGSEAIVRDVLNAMVPDWNKHASN